MAPLPRTESYRWTPILSADGVHYCSPACGGGKFCRKSWHEHAEREADALAAKMGPGWKPVVWENMGWYYRTENGVAAIYANEDRREERVGGGFPACSYTAYVNSVHQFIATAETPEDALGFAVQEARTHVSRINGDLARMLGDEPNPAGPVLVFKAGA